MDIIKESNKVYLLDSEGLEIACVSFPNHDEHTVIFTKTFVDNSLRGMGIAAKLMQAACEVVHEQNKKVILECSYAKKWFQEHPEWQALLL